MTEKQLKGLGFKLTQQYQHDVFRTNKYANGILQVEFTYELDSLCSCELLILEPIDIPITFEEMKALTTILGKNKK